MLDAAEELLKMEQTTGWKILMLKLQGEAEVAKDGFSEVDPYDTSAVVALQDKIRRLHWIEESLTELIHQGLEIESLDETTEEIEDG